MESAYIVKVVLCREAIGKSRMYTFGDCCSGVCVIILSLYAEEDVISYAQLSLTVPQATQGNNTRQLLFTAFLTVYHGITHH